MAQSLPITPKGRAAWINAVEAVANDSGKFQWRCGLNCKEEELTGFFETLAKCVADERERNPQFPKDDSKLNWPYDPAMKREGDELVPIDGEITLKFTRHKTLKTKAGEREQDPPAQFDSKGMPCKLADIPPGSVLRIAYRPYCWTYLRKAGVSIEFAGVQIVKLSEREQIVMGAVEDEDGFVASQTPFTTDVAEDEVPF